MYARASRYKIFKTANLYFDYSVANYSQETLRRLSGNYQEQKNIPTIDGVKGEFPQRIVLSARSR